MFDLHGEDDFHLEEVTIGFVGGGSRSWARKMMNDLGRQDAMHGEVRLYDVDYESAEQNARFGTLIQEHEDAASEWSYSAVESMDDALSGADVVVLSTQDPPAETMAHDLDCPQEYGIYQTVGDTVGPGGVVRSMRAIPQYREIAAAIREACPDALVMNFTNPMTVCTRTLYEEFPEINAVGLCHEVYHVQDWLAELAETHLGAEGTAGQDVEVNVKGINHFTWIDEARYDGLDLFEAVNAELSDQLPIPGSFAPGDLDDESFFVDHNQVKLDLYRRYGMLGAAGDRHLAEFVPWYLNVDEPQEVHRWGIRLTPSEYRVGKWPSGEDTREEYLEGERTFEFSESGEEMVDIMAAYLGGPPLQTNVNVPNHGQLEGVPAGPVVETNAVITDGRITPKVAGALPPAVDSIVNTHVTNQESLVSAGFDGDVDTAFQAFLNDPLVTIQPDRARELFAELVDIQRAYLEDWELDDADVLQAERRAGEPQQPA